MGTASGEVRDGSSQQRVDGLVEVSARRRDACGLAVVEVRLLSHERRIFPAVVEDDPFHPDRSLASVLAFALPIEGIVSAHEKRDDIGDAAEYQSLRPDVFRSLLRSLLRKTRP